MHTSIDHYEPRWLEAHEVLPPEIYDHWGDRGLYLFLDVRVLITADQIRDFFGASYKCNNWWWRRRAGLPLTAKDCFRYRGYRPDSYYTQQGKEPNESGSPHRFGRGLDGDIDGVTAEDARSEIMKNPERFPFIRRIEDGVNWLHFDVANTYHHGIYLIDPRR